MSFPGASNGRAEAKATKAISPRESDSSSGDISQREGLPLQYAARPFSLFSM